MRPELETLIKKEGPGYKIGNEQVRENAIAKNLQIWSKFTLGCSSEEGVRFESTQ